MTLLNKRINKLFDKVLEEYSILFSFAYVYYFLLLIWIFLCISASLPNEEGAFSLIRN